MRRVFDTLKQVLLFCVSLLTLLYNVGNVILSWIALLAFVLLVIMIAILAF